MAAVDLPAAAKFTKIPHGTLRYWASKHRWPVLDHDSAGRKLYDHRIILDHAEAWLARKSEAA